MTVLTSTGAVNLTSSTNWSPAQVPVAGDDLVIGAHTLTLDADLTLDSIFLSHGLARLAMSGTSRTVTATNGITLTGSTFASVFASALTAGQSLTLRGTWITQAATTLTSIVSSTGGDLTLEAVGGAGDVLIASAVTSSQRVIALSWSAGTLTTVGRIDLPNWTAASSLVSMTGGTWNHTHTGLSQLGSGGHVVLNSTGGVTLNWSGDLVSNSTAVNGIFIFASGTSAVTFTGTIKRSGTVTGGNHQAGSWPSVIRVPAASTGTVVNITGALCCAKTSRIVAIDAVGNSPALINWKNQTVNIASTDQVVILGGGQQSFDFTDLVINNSGRFVFLETATSIATASNGCLITNMTPSAQAAVVSGSLAFEGQVLNLESDPPTLPAREVVAGGVEYGYTLTPLTGTGLIVDPAVLAASVGTALENISQAALARFASIDTGETSAVDGSVAKLAQGGAVEVNLQPVLDELQEVKNKLPVEGRAATPDDVSPTIDFNPTIEPTPVTVNPTVLSTESIDAIRADLATSDQVTQAAQSVIDHGDGEGSWGAVGDGGSEVEGDYEVIVEVIDTNTEQPIQLAKVRVYRTGFTSRSKLTDEDGLTAAFGCDAAVFKYVITARGYLSAVGTFEVAGDQTETIELTPSPLADSTTPDGCNCAIDVINSSRVPVEGAIVSAEPTASPAIANSSLIIPVPEPVETDESGRAEIDLIQGVEYRITVTYAAITRSIIRTVPEDTSAILTVPV